MSSIVKCKTCGKDVSKTAPTCPHCGESAPGLHIKCPMCGSMNFSMGQKRFGIGKAAAGAILLGPIGLVSGLLGRKDLELVCLNCKKNGSLIQKSSNKKTPLPNRIKQAGLIYQ